MKKIFAAMIVLAIFSMGSFAKDFNWKNSYANIPSKPAMPKYIPSNYDYNSPKIAPDAQQGFVYADTAQDARYSFLGEVSPYFYEPNSNALLLGGAHRYTNANNIPTGYYYIKYSTDEGKTWRPYDLYNEPNKLAVWPSLAVSNPGKVKDPKKFNYVLSAPVADVQNNYQWAGDMFVVVNGTTSPAEIYNLPIQGPVSHQKWLMTKSAAGAIGNIDAFYNVGTLANDAGYQYGYYGSSSFDMKALDWVSQQVPSQWSVENFKPSTQLNSSYNDYMSIDVDANGNAYAGVKNMFADDPNNRVPAVSKSTDGGATWSDFDRMPYSLFENYVTVMGGDVTKSFFIPYDPEGFVVTGTDEWHFAVRMVITPDQQNYEFHIVDCFKMNGTWQMRKISTFTGTYLFLLEDNGTQTETKDSVIVSRLGNEVQMSKTADGKYVIAKWVDYTGKTVNVTPAPIVVTTGRDQNGNLVPDVPDTIKAIDVTDVFMAYKDVKALEWNTPSNVTNDDIYDKMSMLPLTVPSINKVPLLTQRTAKANYTNPNNPRNQYPAAVMQMASDYWQFTGLTTVSLAQDVKQEQNVGFSINEIYPNPANEKAELSFNLDKTSFVDVQIYNSLGQKVRTVVSDLVGAGINALNIPTSDLQNGSYYVKVNINGSSVTKLMNVIR